MPLVYAKLRDSMGGKIQYAVSGGAPLAMGSDWSVSAADPWQAIHVAVVVKRVLVRRVSIT